MEERDFVGYGRNRPRVNWPNKARLALSIVLNYEEGAEWNPLDDEPLSKMTDQNGGGTRDLLEEASFEYGSRVGVWRLMEIFEKHRVPVTFYACGRAMERNPEVGREIAGNGHEACGHGYRWIDSNLLTREEEKEDIRRCIEAITKVVGQRPLGWFPKAPSPNTQELLVEEGGFIYDSSVSNDDLPYFKQVSGKRLLILPYSEDVNDAKFNQSPGFVSAGQFLDYMKTNFHRLYDEAKTVPNMMSVGLHARISGLPSRAPAIDDFISYVKTFPGVWITRRIDIARWWLENPSA